MPEITGTIDREGRYLGECCWCGRGTTSLALAPGLGEMIPLHVLCAAAVVNAYNRWRRTRLLSPAMEAYLDRLGRVPRLTGGVGWGHA